MGNFFQCGVFTFAVGRVYVIERNDKQDVEAVAASLAIDSHLEFQADVC